MVDDEARSIMELQTNGATRVEVQGEDDDERVQEVGISWFGLGWDKFS